MTTKTELLEILANGENSSVEFKRDQVDNRSLAKELVALVNLQGGQVILGVNDEGRVTGLTRKDEPRDGADPHRPTYRKLEEWVMNACRDKIHPPLIPVFEILRRVENGRDIAIVRVERGISVHQLRQGGHGIYYIRVGSTSREASPDELSRLMQQRRAVRAELQAVSGTTMDDLDARRIADYFHRVRGQVVPAEREDLATLLVNTEILSRESRSATLAGLVLFGNEPSRFLPQAKIEAVAYFGREKEYRAKERRTIRGPYVPLATDQEDVLIPGLVDQATAFAQRNIETVSMQDGLRRVERWDYPELVVREVRLNALVHRDYLLVGTDVELSVYSDRLEVVSPGRLPNGITPEAMVSGCRSARNELVKDVMKDYGYMEHLGMGIPRIVVAGMRRHNGTEPEFEERHERLTVRLWKGAPDRTATFRSQ